MSRESELFNVYMDMDSLGIMLIELGVGCKIDRRFSNNLWYADDLVLLAPTVTALQKPINLCHNYASEHNISFNEKKNSLYEIWSLLFKSQTFSHHLPL